MKRKRASGGGRKPRGGPTSSLTFRIPDAMRKHLEREAAAMNVALSDRLLWHLNRSFNRQRDEERDPALQGLLFLIATLAERISGADYAPSKERRSELRRLWRQDLLYFNAFKLAVQELLDALEKPPGTLPTDEEIKSGFETPELVAMSEVRHLWIDAHNTEKAVELKRQIMRVMAPNVAEMVDRELLAIPRAWKAANTIDTATEKLEEKGQ